MELNEKELSEVAGGANKKSDKWYDYSHGAIQRNGDSVVYTVANGDVLSGIAIRFGVTVQQICEWNNIANPDIINFGQKLTIYPTIPY